MVNSIKNSTLYIIGNGFDRHHSMKTLYSDFGLFLQKNNSLVYDYLIKYLYMNELDEEDEDTLKDPLWKNLEEGFTRLEVSEILDEHSDYAPNFGSDDFSDHEYHAMQQEVDVIKEGLTIRLKDEFEKFILSVTYPSKEDVKLLNLNRESKFLNFNYTDSLEKYYNVSNEDIFHIHGKASNGDKLKLGHGFNPNSFRPEEPKPSVGATEEELDQWHEYMSDQYDYAYESAKESLFEYFTDSLKATDEIIGENLDFFESLGKIEKVIVLGHSLAEVDHPYFKKILDSIDKNAQWEVSFFGNDEKVSHENQLKIIGLKDEQFKLFEFKDIII
jgi:hypothetical protein